MNRFKQTFIDLPDKVLWIWGAGFIARLISSSFAVSAHDYVKNRLPISDCITTSGQWLYCDCRSDHTPLYPYLTALMNWLSPDVAVIKAMMINLPLTIGDALIPVAIFLLLKRYGKESLGITASLFYALNPLPIIEVGLSHWDGITTLCLLASLIYMHDNKLKIAGVFAGLGTLLKQFPLAILLVALTKEGFRRAFVMGLVTVVVILLGFLPFLLNCPETFIDNIFNHPLWKGTSSVKVGIGTIKDVFRVVSMPYPKLVWLILFAALVGIPAFRSNKNNYFFYTGLIMVTLAYFTYVTHRQLIVWALPFMTILCVDKKTLWALGVVLLGYAIRILKPDWYFGLIHLGIGGWFYWQFLKEMLVNQYETKAAIESGSG